MDKDFLVKTTRYTLSLILMSKGQSTFFPAVDWRNSFVKFPGASTDNDNFIIRILDPPNSVVFSEVTSAKDIKEHWYF